MALSAETQASLEEAREALNEFYENRIAEIDRECRNLREYGAPITNLGDQTTEAGTTEALDILNRVGAPVG
jgi:hypothetical protein